MKLKTRTVHTIACFFVLTIIWGPLFYWAQTTRNYYLPDEPIRAHVITSSAGVDPLLPEYGGDTYNDKPPVYRLLGAALIGLDGMIYYLNYSSAILLLFFVYWWAQKIRSDPVLSTALLGITPLFVVAGFSIKIDMFFALIITVTAYFLYRIFEMSHPSPGVYVGLGLGVFVGLLTKGALAFVVPLGLCLAVGFGNGRKQAVFTILGAAGATIITTGFVGWLYDANLLYDYVVINTFNRILDSTGPGPNRGLLAIVSGYPISILPLVPFLFFIRRWDSDVQFFSFWAGIALLAPLFSQSKMIIYILPATVPLALVAGSVNIRRWGYLIFFLFILLFISLFPVVYINPSSNIAGGGWLFPYPTHAAFITGSTIFVIGLTIVLLDYISNRGMVVVLIAHLSLVYLFLAPGTISHLNQYHSLKSPADWLRSTCPHDTIYYRKGQITAKKDGVYNIKRYSNSDFTVVFNQPDKTTLYCTVTTRWSRDVPYSCSRSESHCYPDRSGTESKKRWFILEK